MDTQGLINTGWLLACSALVFIMQAGFCCLETGLVRTKNSINVAIKNLVDLCLAGMLFWAFGFAIMFGESANGWYGTTNFLFDATDTQQTVFFLFQLMFCGAATTIVAGAVAERMRFSGYIVVAMVTSGLIYPLFGHWAWGAGGWLAELGFRDFAGSTAVHGIGAWVALAACLVIGPRLGRFDNDKKRELFGHNLPMATVGVMLLWFGWFGFNGGSGLVLDESVPRIVTATVLAGMAGGITSLVISWLITKHADVLQVMNGILAGLVAITASCNVVSLPSAVLIGAIGGGICVFATWGIERLKIDDVVGAVPVHGCAGVWGTLAVALFAKSNALDTGLGLWQQLAVQCLGVLVCFGFAFGGGLLILALINQVIPLRVTQEDEEVGLNVAEHSATTETHQLVQEMQEHHRTGDFSSPVSLESYTEIGQIASQYNRVLNVVDTEQKNLLTANKKAIEANNDLQSTQSTLEVKLNELAEFNDLAVDRELRMIELKNEINALCLEAGLSAKYDLDFEEMQEVEG